MTAVGNRTENDAMAEVLLRHFEPQVQMLERGTDDAAAVLILPTGMTAHSVKKFVDEYLPAPERRKGTATLTSLGSFIEHVKRFADADSVVFADVNPDAPRLTAVLDYHRAGAAGDPRFGGHRATYAFPLSDEWKTWQEIDEKWVGQGEFAQTIEDRILDVVDPAQAGDNARAMAQSLGADFAGPSKVLELSRGLAVRVNSVVREARNLSTGEVQIGYEEQHTNEAGAPIKIPGAFLLGVPVFRGGAPYQIPARLRYRVASGKILWSIALYRTDRAFEHAVREAVDQVRAETKLPVLEGSPEAG